MQFYRYIADHISLVFPTIDSKYRLPLFILYSTNMESHNLRSGNLLASSREKKQKASGKPLAKYPHHHQQQQQPIDCCESIQGTQFSTNKTAVQMELKPKAKQTKLLSSKSLSQLVPRGLFFKKSKDNSVDNKNSVSTRLTTTRSFPNYAYCPDASMQENPATEFIVNRVNSVSLIGLPRQSTSNVFGCNSFDNTLEGISLSPIVGSQEKGQTVAASVTPYKDVSFTTVDDNKNNKVEENNKAGGNPHDLSDNGKKKAISSKLKAFKNTKLVLRDVKNSIGLRMKAKQESQAFTKLTNELATPPTKLYSPFNIYTPDKDNDKTNESKSRRMLQLSKSGSKVTTRSGSLNSNLFNAGSSMVNIESKQQQQQEKTPKQRIALQHKKHLMQTNNFTFDSPTGKFRETIKDVEQFQQCIEDISQAIRARDLRQSSRNRQ